MSNQPEEKTITSTTFGWAFLGLLSMFAWIATLIGQFFGVGWFWPWIFVTLFVVLVVKTSKEKRK